MDQDGKSDPYIKVRLGKKVVNKRKSTSPEALIPSSFSELTWMQSCQEHPNWVDCYDYDFIGQDDLIGTTYIDLEDRLFDKRWRVLGAGADRDAPCTKACGEASLHSPLSSAHRAMWNCGWTF